MAITVTDITNMFSVAMLVSLSIKLAIKYAIDNDHVAENIAHLQFVSLAKVIIVDMQGIYSKLKNK